MKYFISSLVLLLLVGQSRVLAQHSKPTPPRGSSKSTIDKSNIVIATRSPGLPTQNRILDRAQVNYDHLEAIPLAIPGEEQLQLFKAKDNGMTTWIKGELKEPTPQLSPQANAFEYLNAVKATLNIDSPEEEFVLQSSRMDQQQHRHLRMQQVHQGLKVYGAEVMLHEKDGSIYLFNGRYFPSPKLEQLSPSISQSQAEALVKSHLSNTTSFEVLSNEQKPFISGPQWQSDLVIYHQDGQIDGEQLVWHITVIPNLSNRWEYFVDAIDGTIIHQFNNICQVHGWHPEHDHHHHAPFVQKDSHPSKDFTLPPPGPITTNEFDLFGISRTINLWEENGIFYLIDGSRDMFNAQASNVPSTLVGVIATYDAQNIWPTGPGANVLLMASNFNAWPATAVSAHYNAGIAYEYFKNTFGRNSIKDEGENIVSIINVPDEDGNDFDNAFWNGAAMFYGNGAQVFNAPLAKALDVAGHEMSHGVVQSTANLAYQNESGALNESFADIFGAMIDRDDWQIGEEVANPQVFPTGTMRDMANPNNGGNPGDFFWQPQTYSERFTGSADNGGVHINSGIPNHAFFLFANNPNVGRAKAEQVFYKALTDYLVMSSTFVDLRIAVLQAAEDLHGINSSEYNAAAFAFDQVEIFGNQGGSYQNDLNANPGDEFIIWSDPTLSNINNANPDGNPLFNFSTDNHISKPSVTDDGTIVVYVDADRRLREFDLDWSSGSPQVVANFVLNETIEWRNIVTSKDGTKIAALSGNVGQGLFDNEIFVFDFISGTSQSFVLSNPTFTTGVSTGDVEYADALEWDVSGQYILYDAFNRIENQLGQDISYWDIGIIKVWDNDNNNFEDPNDPTISKLFSSLPENVSVGNPTFAKNSPYIIAFDYIESTFFGTDYQVRTANIQTGDQGLVFENNTLGYPNYNIEDDRMLFSVTNAGEDVLGFRQLTSDKLSGAGDAFVLVNNAFWGAYFAIGERNLTSTASLSLQNDAFKVYPNPMTEQLTVELEATIATEVSVQVYDLLGKLVFQSELMTQSGPNQIPLSLGQLAPGTYQLRLESEGMIASQLITKF
ncbi:MAG: M4 family metallopeptidase [Bacteroidota bacterium]